MPDLDKIIYFASLSDAGAFKTGAVDGGIGANFNVVFDHDISHLIELDMAPLLINRISKAARSDDGPWLDDDTASLFDIPPE